MIHQALGLIINQLDDYLKSLNASTVPQVVAGNISLSSLLNAGSSGSDYMSEKVVVTVVNIMEEATLKNVSPYRTSSSNSEIENPPVFVNLYLLFSANFNAGDAAGTGQNYYRALAKISQVIAFFQGKPLFTVSNSPSSDFAPETFDPIDPPTPEVNRLTLKMEMVTLTFEQVNYLWGTLGGKQLPFVLYKAHVMPITRSLLQDRGMEVRDIQSLFHQKDDIAG